MKFPLVKLTDYQARREELEASDNPFALVTLAVLRYIEEKGDLNRLYEAKKELFKLLFEKGYDKARIEALFRFIDWAIQLPKELEEQFEKDLPGIDVGGKSMPYYITSWERIAKEEEKIETAKKMIEKGLDMELIIEITGLSEEKVSKLQNDVNKPEHK
jgi:hypothetical protein